ncbi:MAG: hypothetical protein DRR42_01720 [Gammaproteobacteria bacterium]|nr:MAG: hypothetical protein DRR42_01720 [Gammaproteobacteria bacterium]
MLEMTLQLDSLTTADNGQVIARGRARVTGANTRLWIELQFEPEHVDVWDEAYDRMLELLDIA